MPCGQSDFKACRVVLHMAHHGQRTGGPAPALPCESSGRQLILGLAAAGITFAVGRALGVALA
jgi:hypothetical protein